MSLGKMSKDEEYMNIEEYDWNICLNEEEMNTLNEWHDKLK